jgi:hypothetical protein
VKCLHVTLSCPSLQHFRQHQPEASKSGDWQKQQEPLTQKIVIGLAHRKRKVQLKRTPLQFGVRTAEKNS